MHIFSHLISPQLNEVSTDIILILLIRKTETWSISKLSRAGKHEKIRAEGNWDHERGRYSEKGRPGEWYTETERRGAGIKTTNREQHAHRTSSGPSSPASYLSSFLGISLYTPATSPCTQLPAVAMLLLFLHLFLHPQKPLFECRPSPPSPIHSQPQTVLYILSLYLAHSLLYFTLILMSSFLGGQPETGLGVLVIYWGRARRRKGERRDQGRYGTKPEGVSFGVHCQPDPRWALEHK